MKIVILCGGKGTRLGTETEFLPKPMITIGDKPILWHIMKMYSQQGFNEFILCLGYKGDVIRQYFLNYPSMNDDIIVRLGSSHKETLRRRDNEDWEITFIDTGQENLKGSRIKQVEPYIQDENFMATYGDGISDLNLNNLLQFHETHGKTSTLTGVFPPSRFGEILVEGDRVSHFTEKPQTSAGIINGGFFVFNKRIFQYLSNSPDCDLEQQALEQLAQEKELMVFKHKGFWECMDTIRDVRNLNQLWDKNRAPWATWL